MGDNRWLKNSFVYLIILVAALALFFNYFNGQQNAPDEVAITEVIALAKDNKIDQIKPQAASNDFTFTRKDTPNKTFRSRLEANDSITDLLVQSGVDPNNVDVIVQPAPAWGGLLNIFTILLPVLLMIGFFIFFMRQAQGSNNQALSFGKSRARMFSGDKPTITFADVAGQEEAKQDLTEVVEFLKFPDKFAALGARIPRGVLPTVPRLVWLLVLIGDGTAALASGEPFIDIGSAHLGLGGLLKFLQIMVLSIVLLGLGGLVSWTTNVAEVAPAAATLGRPLKWLRIPVDEWAVTLALALRAFPMLIDEYRVLFAARRLRPKVRPETRRARSRQRRAEIVDLLAAAVTVALRRGDEMGDAITARGGVGQILRASRGRHAVHERGRGGRG